MTDRPKDWSIRNGCFIGYCLVNEPPKTNSMGMKQAPEQGWRFFAIDMREVTHIGVWRGHEDEGCVIFRGSAEIATLNCTAEAFVSQWLDTRHVFERIPTSDQALRAFGAAGRQAARDAAISEQA